MSDETKTELELVQLIEHNIDVEEIDKDLYRSKYLWKPSGGRGVFGGQTIAQSLWAATLSIRRDDPGTRKGPNSLHCYFLNFGNADHPILYSVQRLRDGRSYSTRTVLATQNGVPIFSLTCSFCVPEPQQPRTVLPLPAWPLKLGALGRIEDIPSPEECPPTEDRLAVLMDQKELPGKVKDYLHRISEERRLSSIEIRNCNQSELLPLISVRRNADPDPQQMHWFRSRGPGKKNDPAFQKCVLAYASDLSFIGTAARAMGLGARTEPRLGMLASLDHAMYFYDDEIDTSDWCLFYMESQVVSGGRGLVRGQIYRRDGTLAVACTQEGVVRSQL